MIHETDIPTQQKTSKKNPRFSFENENSKWKKSHQPEATQRSQAPCCVRYSLSRSQKLVYRQEFLTLYREGSRWSGESLLFFYFKSLPSFPKLGITIGKKWGKSHERNRFKRVIREGFRKAYPLIPEGLMLNVHPKEGYRQLTSNGVELELKRFISSCVQAQSQSTTGCCHN